MNPHTEHAFFHELEKIAGPGTGPWPSPASGLGKSSFSGGASLAERFRGAAKQGVREAGKGISQGIGKATAVGEKAGRVAGRGVGVLRSAAKGLFR